MEKKQKQARRKTDWEADEPSAEAPAAAKPAGKPAAAAKKDAKAAPKASLLSFGGDEDEESVPVFKPKKSAPVRAPAPPPDKPKADRPVYQTQPGEYSAERLREVSVICTRTLCTLLHHKSKEHVPVRWAAARGCTAVTRGPAAAYCAAKTA